MKSRFNLQFFGGVFGGGGSTTNIPNRGPEPEELTNLRKQLYSKITPGLQAFDTNNWQNAQNTTNQALQQQSSLLGQIPNVLSQNNNLVNEITDIARTGNIPSGLSNALNASVNQNLQSSMGTMLNNLGKRGILNSSVTSSGMNQLSQAAADAYNRNYQTAYQSVLSGLGQGLQGSQNNTASLLSALGAVGKVPSQTYEALGAGLQIPMTLWEKAQNFYQNDNPHTTIYEPPSYCITGDTLITLEDGREIPVAELKDDDKIKVWDFENGRMTSAPLTGFFKDSNEGLNVVRVEFEDGSNVGVIVEHLFFDMMEGKFIAINSDSQEYVGHEFAKVNAEGQIVPVKVSRIYLDGKTTETFGPQPEGHWNYLAGGFISGNDGQLAMCNMFEYDAERMVYAKRDEDLKQYGKLSYDVFDGIISKRTFYSNHFDECSVAFGKGLARCENFRAYIAKFAGYFFDEGSNNDGSNYSTEEE